MSYQTPGHITGERLRADNPLRQRVRPGLEDYYDLYTLELGGELQGITDEYGTCHWAAPEGCGPDGVEELFAEWQAGEEPA